MTNLNNLQDLIDQQAATEFDVKFDGDFDNADARIAYQAVKNTPEFKKFRDWKKSGATIKKGSKAFPIWGQPVGTQKESAALEKGEEYSATMEERSKFPICYVFSNLQVILK